MTIDFNTFVENGRKGRVKVKRRADNFDRSALRFNMKLIYFRYSLTMWNGYCLFGTV